MNKKDKDRQKLRRNYNGYVTKCLAHRKKLIRGNNLEVLNAVFSSSLESYLSQANKLPPLLYLRWRALIQKLIRRFPEAATGGVL